MDTTKKIITLSPPKPHSIKQELIMGAFLIPGLTEIYICAGSKFGKTLAASAAITNGVMSHPQSLYRWVAPIYEQSKIGFNYCRQILPPDPITNVKRGSLELELPETQSRIKFHHAQNPVSLEGAAVNGYVFDEAAKMSEDVYGSAKTTRTVTRGTMMFISTPYGKNWFYKKCMEAKDEMLRARFEKRLPTKLLIRARTADNPNVPRESIEEARRELPSRLFRQYFEAEFVDDGTVFTNYLNCLDGPQLEMYGDNQRWLHPLASEATVVIGADWAKMTDWTVFTAIEIRNGRKRIVGFDRFHRCTYIEAIRRLVMFSRKFKSVEIVYHDKTGVGIAIDEQMGYTDLTHQGIVFTNTSKSEMVNRLMTTFEHEEIIIPRWQQMISELDSFDVTVTSMGNMKYEAAKGGHDDIICSLMLANQAAEAYGEKESEAQFLEDLKDDLSSSPISDYYNSIDDDDD